MTKKFYNTETLLQLAEAGGRVIFFTFAHATSIVLSRLLEANKKPNALNRVCIVALPWHDPMPAAAAAASEAEVRLTAV